MTADLKEFFRIKMAIFSSIVTPVVMMISFGLGVNKEGLLFFAPGILAIGTMFGCTYTVGYTIIIDRQRRTISDIVLSPISYGSFVIARILGGIVKCCFQLFATVLIGVIFFKLPLSHPLLLVLAFILTAIFFGGIGMIFASSTNALSFPGIVNIVIIPFMFFCGVFFPVNNFIEWVSLIVKFLPFTASVEIFRYAVTDKFLTGNLIYNIGLLTFHSFLVIWIGIHVFKRSAVR
jgi:ABC-2 type transport system permease protein